MWCRCTCTYLLPSFTLTLLLFHLLSMPIHLCHSFCLPAFPSLYSSFLPSIPPLLSILPPSFLLSLLSSLRPFTLPSLHLFLQYLATVPAPASDVAHSTHMEEKKGLAFWSSICPHSITEWTNSHWRWKCQG